jgi:3-deoxy-D-manno-octulosonic-acid transferase
MLSGPHTQNSQDIADLFEQTGALRIVRSQDELGYRLLDWLGNAAQARADGARGRDAVAANRGAVDRLVSMVEPLLSSSA